MAIKSKRLGAGAYEVTDGMNTVSISLIDFYDGPGWIAAAKWTSTRYSDPLVTKREAMAVAVNMLATANDF